MDKVQIDRRTRWWEKNHPSKTKHIIKEENTTGHKHFSLDDQNKRQALLSSNFFVLELGYWRTPLKQTEQSIKEEKMS